MALCKTIPCTFTIFSIFHITYIYLLINHYTNNSGINATELKCEWKQGHINSFGMYKLRVYLKYTKVNYMRKIWTPLNQNQLSGQIFREKAILRAEWHLLEWVLMLGLIWALHLICASYQKLTGCLYILRQGSTKVPDDLCANEKSF